MEPVSRAPTRMPGRAAALAVSAVLVVTAAAGCGGGKDEAAPPPAPPVATTSGPTGTSGTTTARAKHYTLAATRRCLEQAGLLVGPVETTDPRLRALGDLAQRTSVLVRADGTVIGLALGDAELLADLLAVPNDPYTIETRGNAVLLYQPSAKREASVVRGCLRS